MAVNISPRQIQENVLEAAIKNALGTHGVNNNTVIFEITENIFVDTHKERIIAHMSNDAEVPIRLWLDDFGMDYSSLGALRKFSVEILKIDRSFIVNLDESSEDFALVGAIIAIAQALNIKVVAEDVKTREQLNLVRAMGADFIQGYFFSKPVPAADFAYILQKSLPRRSWLSFLKAHLSSLAGPHTGPGSEPRGAGVPHHRSPGAEWRR